MLWLRTINLEMRVIFSRFSWAVWAAKAWSERVVVFILKVIGKLRAAYF